MTTATVTIIFILASLQNLLALPAKPDLKPDLIASIQKVQQEHGKKVETSNVVPLSNKNEPTNPESNEIDRDHLNEKDLNQDKDTPPEHFSPESLRQNKMLGFYGYYPPPFPTFAPIPAYYPTLPMEFYGAYPDYSTGYSGGGNFNYNNVNYNPEYNDGEDDVMSRANTKKRPSSGGNHFKNSPIYYIRLPPTPYMFVPGLGYISNPPTIQPLAPVMPTVPTMPTPLPMSPFYNLPINFVSNAKPTGVYQWGAPNVPSPMSAAGFGVPPVGPQNMYQTNPQRPARPSYQRPSYQRPQNNPYSQDSKVTNLKGQFLFNGRPEEIYLLPNLQNPYNSGYYSDPYSYNNYNQGYNGYY